MRIKLLCRACHQGIERTSVSDPYVCAACDEKLSARFAFKDCPF